MPLKDIYSDNLGAKDELVYYNFYVPSKEIADKISFIQAECSLNIPLQSLDGLTPYEVIIKRKNPQEYFHIFPEKKEVSIYKYYKKAVFKLKGEEDFRYPSVYSKSGGVLNLFHPQIKKDMDNQLIEILSRGKNRKEALREWSNTPSDLWSGLPPKLVWAGGGKAEFMMILDFFEYFDKIVKNLKFESFGEMIISSATHLRAWQLYNLCKSEKKSPMEMVFEERQEIYRRKISFLKSLGIETDFS